MALNGTEVLQVQGRDNIGRPAGPTLTTTTAAIAALGGGAAAGPVTSIDSGTSYTTDSTDTFILWKTATLGTKITYVTTSDMVNGQVMIIKDYGAADYSQTVQAFEGGITIENEASYIFTPANGTSINLKWDAPNLNLIIW